MTSVKECDPDQSVLFDTNILIDYLRRKPLAHAEVMLFKNRAISAMTWMEVMAGAPHHSQRRERNFLAAFELISVTPEIMERAAFVRRKTRLKLPDAIIMATAQVTKRLLISRNTRDFHEDDAGVRVPYKL